MSFLHNVLLCRPFCVQVAEFFFCGCPAVAFRYLILGPSELKEKSFGIWNVPLVNITTLETNIMILVDSHLKIMIYNPKRHKIPNGRSIGVVKGCENLNVEGKG